MLPLLLLLQLSRYNANPFSVNSGIVSFLQDLLQYRGRPVENAAVFFDLGYFQTFQRILNDPRVRLLVLVLLLLLLCLSPFRLFLSLVLSDSASSFAAASVCVVHRCCSVHAGPS